MATTRIDPAGPVILVQRVGDARWREAIRGTTGQRLFAIAWTSDNELLVWRNFADGPEPIP